MSVLNPASHRIPRRLAVAAGVLLGIAGLLVGGWLLWSVLRPPPGGFAPTVGEAQVVDADTGLRQYTIDARGRQRWAHFSFVSDAEIEASLESLDWDIAFRRTDVITNGGETNPAGIGAAADLGNVPLLEANVSAAGFLADVVDDERGLESPALHSWYGYNWMTHVISSDGHTYGVRTAAGDTALITFLSYYCDDGSAGCITFQYLYPADPALFANEY